jgi:hypothetical protein
VDKAFIAQGVANKLWAAEASLDTAMADASKLMTAVLEAREQANVTHMVIDPSVAKISEAIATMTAARRTLMEAHVAMAEAKLRVGVRTKLVGVSPTIAEDYSALKMAIDNERKTA